MSVIETFVIRGAWGDLTGRYLLPGLARLAAIGQLSSSLRILAVDRAEAMINLRSGRTCCM